MKTTLSTLSVLPETKEQIKTFAYMAINEVLLDGRNPLELDMRLKALEDLVKLIRKDERLKESILNELSKYPEKTVSFRGADFQKKTTRKYFYQTDPVWVAINEKITVLNENRKDRESLLKILKDPIVDSETGEFINPIRSQDTETYAILIK